MSTAIWTMTSSLAGTRRSHTATLLPSGKVLVVGGADGQNTILSRAELYDPTSGTWTPAGSLRAARVDHTATLLPNGNVLVAGGRSGLRSIASAKLYDPATGKWTSTGSLRKARSLHTATCLQSGLVLVAGGLNDEDFPDRQDSAELYDSATGKWSATGSLTLDRGRESHAAVRLDNGMVLAVGGRIFGPEFSTGAELYNPSSGTWSPTSNPATTRINHTATVLQDGKVLIVGGVKSNGIGDELDSAELYDPTNKRFTVTGRLNVARNQQTATMLPDGRVLVAGGFRFIVTTEITHASTIRHVELYDPAQCNWTTTATLNKPRADHTATLLLTGKVLVAGGEQRGDNSFVTLDNAELFRRE